MEMKRLYVRAGGKVGGPFDMEQVRQGVRLGKLTPAHEASADGQTWFRLETIWRNLVEESAVPADVPGRPKPDPVNEPFAETSAVSGEAVPTSRTPPPLPGSPVFEEVEAPAVVIETASGANTPFGAWAGVRTTSIASSEGLVDAAVTMRYAPAYIPALFDALRILVLFAGFLYAGVSLTSVFVILSKEAPNARTAPDALQLVAGMQVMMTVGAVLLDVIMGIVLLCWLRNVFARIRVFQRKVGSESFSTWAVSYFMPVVTIFTFSTFLSRIWNASSAGKRTKGVRNSKPQVVTWGSICRGIVWISYLATAAAFAWAVSLGVELQQARSAASYRSVSRQQAQVAADSLRRVAGRVDTAGTVLLGLIATAAAASAAVMYGTYVYASTVHQNMMAIQDPDDAESTGAPAA